MTFLDTNVFVYFVDGRACKKQAIARKLIENALSSSRYAISVQVLNEFANVAMKKFQMDEGEVVEYIEAFHQIKTIPPSVEQTLNALSHRKHYGIQFYDSLIVAAAEHAGCDELVTEDLNDGQIYGSVKAVNPFKNFGQTGRQTKGTK